MELSKEKLLFASLGLVAIGGLLFIGYRSLQGSI